jgi:hypothetical protein
MRRIMIAENAAMATIYWITGREPEQLAGGRRKRMATPSWDSTTNASYNNNGGYPAR